MEAITTHAPEVVVHAAAWTRVDAAESDPEAVRAVNVEGTRAVADAVGKIGALMVYLSTDYVFSGEQSAPYREDDETRPGSVYGQTKLQGEAAVGVLGHHLIVRTSWVFGEGVNFVRSILGAAPAGEELSVVADQRGRPTYAADLARGLLRLIEARARGTYHLAGGGAAATWADLAEAALAGAGFSTRVRRISTAEYTAGLPGLVAARPANSVLDCSKAASLGISLRPWRKAVAKYVRGFGS